MGLPNKQNRENALTGSLLFRDSGKRTEDKRKLMFVCGFVAVPDRLLIKSDYIYPIAGMLNTINSAPIFNIFVNLKAVVTQVKHSAKSFSALLKEKIWEV